MLFFFVRENEKKIFDKSSYCTSYAVRTAIGPADSHLSLGKNRHC